MEGIVEQIGGITVITLPGDHLDASNAKAFKIALQPVVESSTQVVLDLHNLQFVDSSGLGAMLSCRRILREKGGDLKLCRATRQVTLAFELVNAHKIFEFFPTSAEAVKSFRQSHAA